MRTIPPELLSRVKKRWQVPAENAESKMKILLSRGFLNELFQVFTIQEGSELTDVDVTVRRPDTTALPAEAYAIAINSGVAEIKSKPLPYDDQIPWVNEFNVTTGVTSVAIEFDGYWDRDYNTRRFNFVTEEYPWLFYAKAGNLYAQYWQDEPTIIATDVTKVAAIRGWVPVAGDTTNDQGLIIAYLKTNGEMYYRNYCIQSNGEKNWEIQREITELGDGIDNLALFRTNDFRVGFIAEKNGEIYWTLTERNYAAMSYWPDFVTGGFGVTKVTPTEITKDNIVTSAEYAAGEYKVICIGVNKLNLQPGTCVKSEPIDSTNLKITFNQIIKYVKVSEIKISNVLKTFYYEIQDIDVDGYDLIITTTTNLDLANDILIEVGDAAIFTQPAYKGSMLPMAAFSILASLLVDPYHFSYVGGYFGVDKIDVLEIHKTDTAIQNAGSLSGNFGVSKIELVYIEGGDV